MKSSVMQTAHITRGWSATSETFAWSTPVDIILDAVDISLYAVPTSIASTGNYVWCVALQRGSADTSWISLTAGDRDSADDVVIACATHAICQGTANEQMSPGWVDHFEPELKVARNSLLYLLMYQTGPGSTALVDVMLRYHVT